MLVFSHVNIILLWVLVLIPSLVKMMIIIRMSVRCMCCFFYYFFWTMMRTVFTSLIWFLDAFSWICAYWFSSRLLWFWIFSIISSYNFFSISNFLIWFSCSWLWLRRQWFYSFFSSILPSRSSPECSFLLLFFNFLIFVISVLLWFRSQKISSVLLDTLSTFVNFNLCVFLPTSYFC